MQTTTQTTTSFEPVTIQLPATMKSYLDYKVASGECANSSEYVQELIERDWQRELEEKLLESIADGEKGLGIEWTKEESEKLRKEVKERLAARRRQES